MCLGVPGKVIHIDDNDIGMTMGVVSFGGIKKDVCLACVPEVEVGQYVIVHPRTPGRSSRRTPRAPGGTAAGPRGSGGSSGSLRRAWPSR